MRYLIRDFDHWLSRVEKVYVFCEEADCILRLQVAKAPHRLKFIAQDVSKGQPVLMLHLWNERIPLIPPAGADLSWAVKTYRLIVHSLHRAGAYLKHEPGFEGIQAIGGVSAIFSLSDPTGGAGMARRLGFEVVSFQNPLGGFGEFWENFYSWWLMWTYNPTSLQHRDFFRQQRTEIWMPTDEFLKRYG
jgi:hypothetical protein